MLWRNISAEMWVVNLEFYVFMFLFIFLVFFIMLL